jgi:hypothetical protein
MESADIQMLITALIKSATYKPLTRSTVMPIKPFANLFNGWADNEQLTIKQLRLKTITLMALTLMLRPSDIAPKSVHFNRETLDKSNWLFTTDNIRFSESGVANIVFHGTKNDTSRSGFEVQMMPTQVLKLNPVHALQMYIARTSKFRSQEKPVFLSLLPPYGPIAASTVACVLNEAIQLAGLSNQGYSAKKF